MKRLKGIGTFGWLVALVVGLGLLAIVSPYLGNADSASRVPSSPTAIRAGGLPGPAPSVDEQPTPDFFLHDYDELAHDSAIVASVAPSVGDIVGFMAKFGLVLVLLYGSLRALRGFALRQRGMTSSSPEVVILETTHLSPRRALYLVSAGPKVLLLGGTDQQITFLAELADMDMDLESDWKAEKEKGHRREL